MVDDNKTIAEEIFPIGYESWRHCIEVKCGLSLTPEFLQTRITILGNPEHPESRRFADLYGDSYRKQVLTWFQQAAAN